jgi:hypothetical protein
MHPCSGGAVESGKARRAAGAAARGSIAGTFRRRMCSNPSIERTPNRLRRLVAAHVER